MKLRGPKPLRPGFATRAELHALGDAQAYLRNARDFQAQDVYDAVAASLSLSPDDGTGGYAAPSDIPTAEVQRAITRVRKRLNEAHRKLHQIALDIVTRHATETRLADPPVLYDYPALPHFLHGSCRTWWSRPTESILPDGSGVTAMCSLDADHASPHVNLLLGDVRLGHEDDLAHVPPDFVQWQSDDVTRTLQINRLEYMITGQDTYDLWSAIYARPHDHTTCGICPEEVW